LGCTVGCDGGLTSSLDDTQLDAVVRASVHIALEPLPLGELVDALARDVSLASIPRAERLLICDQLCRTPTRVLCTAEP
jgi:hypothetical protein